MSIDPASGSAGVLITMGRVYEEVTGARRDIGTLDGKVERALELTADHEQRIRHVEQQMAPMVDHEPRLSSVEKKVWSAAGASAVVAAGISAVATLLATKH